MTEKNSTKSDKDTKLDVLNILANVCMGGRECLLEVRAALQGISEWFDEYIVTEESEPGKEPELHKAMVLLLARCWEYKLKTEDVLELTGGDRKIALYTVVGLLEDGETYSTELKQRQKPGQGQMGQWEHELVCYRYEKPLLLQICRLLRGFTHPTTYFESNGEELTLYSVEKFADEVDSLLNITLESRLIEKLSLALYNTLFDQEDKLIEQQEKEGIDDDITYNLLEESEHLAVASVHEFLHNLYCYATVRNEEFRVSMLMDTSLIPRLILPYLERCVLHATILNSRAEAYSDILEGDRISEMALHNPQLVKGIAASLRTLIISSFRAPSTQFIVTLLRSLNPTAQMLRASAFCRHHDYIFALLCMLNVNMSALDLSQYSHSTQDTIDSQYAHILLEELASIYISMDLEKQSRVCKRVMFSGALPISRDTSSYAAVMSVLNGGSVGQFNYLDSCDGPIDDMNMTLRDGSKEEEEQHVRETRAEIKKGRGGSNFNGNANNDHGSDDDKDEFNDNFTLANIAESKASYNNPMSYDNNGLDVKSESKSTSRSNNIEDKRRDEKGNGGFRLLGDLPSLGVKDKDNIKIALSLELPNENVKKPLNMNINNNKFKLQNEDPSIPKEFVCAINGHILKDPVRSKISGVVFEKQTIELWLDTRGAICPITNEPLTISDLEPDDDLRSKIKRFHIQQTQKKIQKHSNIEDDLYDF